MRILVIQLARFGDIYQTRPVLRALQRTRPSAELHVLVRSRFQEAVSGFPGVTVHTWPTADILQPILLGEERPAAEVETEVLGRFMRVAQPHIDQRYDLVINLSFSPFSSYLTDLLSGSDSEVRGYTRHTDGHLDIPDDSSAFFYAQTGVGRANRYHVTDLFAAVAGVDLIAEDHWLTPPVAIGERGGIIAHLGASTENKTYLPERWVIALKEILADCTESITLIGSENERAMSETVALQLGSDRVFNCVGQSGLSELMGWIARARLLIGADSAPVHIAALTDTPVLNLSSASVSFWETGPRSSGSRVLYSANLHGLAPQRVSAEALAMIRQQPPTGPCAIRDSLESPYRLHELRFDDFSWRLVEALYTGTDYPKAERREDVVAFQRLVELSELACHQLDRWNDPKARSTAAQVLAQVDQLLPEISRLNPRIEPVVQWFETQRLRIPPGEASATLQRTRKAFDDLRLVAEVYREFQDPKVELRRALALVSECAPELREYQFAAVEAAVQSLITILQELARHSTKVGTKSWSSVLQEFDEHLSGRDFIAVADFLEWKLAPALRAQLTERETLYPDVLS